MSPDNYSGWTEVLNLKNLFWKSQQICDELFCELKFEKGPTFNKMDREK